MSTAEQTHTRTPPTDDELRAILRARFGHADFRPGQLQAIRGTCFGVHQLVLLPTGTGKSLLYQLPSTILPRMTLVVSPLVALMEDQLRSLRRNGIEAACMHSGQTQEELAATMQRMRERKLKVLLAAPERLTLRRMQEALVVAGVSLIAVDEAHCVSEWGHDFRPEYRQLQPLIRRLRCTVLAVTATATEAVQDDICAGLGLRDAVRRTLGVDRPNLRFGIRRIRRERDRLSVLAEMAARAGRRAGLIYVSTRREADDLAYRLTRCLGERVGSYHAGLPPEHRARRQEEFLRGRRRLLVATSAFGMGVDKPDVRFVLHARPPRSMEDYVQEAGRAGRDGAAASCCLISGPVDFDEMRSEAAASSGLPELLELRRRRIESMELYVSSETCRRAEILKYFGAASPDRSVCCDRCNPWRWNWLS